jgi:hypothetical protein
MHEGGPGNEFEIDCFLLFSPNWHKNSVAGYYDLREFAKK